MWPDLEKWGLIRTLANGARAQAKMTLIWPIFNLYLSFYFHVYFWILKLCGIEVDVHVKCFFFIKYTCYFKIRLIYTPISDIYFYLHVAIATVVNK